MEGHGENILRFLSNPFLSGETVRIPAGTPFETDDPKFPAGKGHAVRTANFTVDYAISMDADRVNFPSFSPNKDKPRVGVLFSTEYTRNYELTEELLRENGKLVVYEEFVWEPKKSSG